MSDRRIADHAPRRHHGARPAHERARQRWSLEPDTRSGLKPISATLPAVLRGIGMPERAIEDALGPDAGQGAA